MIEFRLLGSVELVVDGQTVDLGPSKQRGIVAALLAEPEQSISTDALVARVWDAPPETIRNSVYTYMTRLRRILRMATAHTGESPEIRRVHGSYRIEVPRGAVDLSVFRDLVERARAMSPADPARAETLSRALALWRGEPLAGLDSDWVRRFRDSLRQLRHEAIAEWADAELRRGNPKPVAADLRKALLEHPLAEDLHERLLRAYHLDNRDAEALAHYDRLRRTLASELGVDPSPRLRELHAQLLAGDGTPETVPAEPVSVRSVPEPDPMPGVPDSPREHPAAEVVDPRGFRGRVADIDRIRRALTEGSATRPVLITGSPGIGKSALAVRVAESLCGHFPDGVLRVDLGGSASVPAEPLAVLGHLLSALGVPAALHPRDLSARAARYRAELADRRVLLLLDDAASPTQLTPLLTVGSGSAVLVTSRIGLDIKGIRKTVLRELTMTESMEVLCALLGEERVYAEEWAATALVRCCSGIPLALYAVGSRLAARPHWTITQQLGRMSEEQRRLHEFAYGAADVRNGVAVMVGRLSPAAARVLRHLGTTLSPRERFSTVTVTGLADPAAALAELHDAHLVTRTEPDGGPPQYVMLEIHRLFAKHLMSSATPAALPA